MQDIFISNIQINKVRYLKELEIDTKKLKEAEKIWKY